MTRTSFAYVCFACISWGCAADPARRVDPDERSALAHRQEAAHEAQAAHHHESQYSPNATEVSPFRARSGDGDLTEATAVVNPTEIHLTQAQWHKAHAEAHLKAAQQLERFEDEACKGTPVKERAACPLLGPVTHIRDVEGGVAIDLSPKVDAAQATAVMRCHYAFARTRGFAPEAAACPLYVRGLNIEQAGAHTVEITAKDAATVKHVRDSARAESVAAP
ncbi:MAG: hypothetical protein SF187_04945 [Deltaproteobacteria bacterium]|nr:hypothetical protein [Deltaproteobacteria bacterium]